MINQDPFQEANGPIPRPNLQALETSLREGHLSIPNAIAQIGVVIRDTLKSIEIISQEQATFNQDQKLRLDRMDKIVNELSEKCQGMQQALLYKEEKYDEKCREVERYKVICELSAKAAVSDNQYFQQGGEVNNNVNLDYGGSVETPIIPQRFVKTEPRQGFDSRIGSEQPYPRHRVVKEHTKLTAREAHMSQYVNPFRSPRSYSEERSINESEEPDLQPVQPQYYAGGPCRRKIPIVNKSTPKTMDCRTRTRMESIGGINIRGPPVKTGPVDMDRLTSRSDPESRCDNPTKRVKIDLTSQRNEVLSSSGNLANQMRQQIIEKDLHRQVAGGCWTRLAGRRRKDWPF